MGLLFLVFCLGMCGLLWFCCWLLEVVALQAYGRCVCGLRVDVVYGLRDCYGLWFCAYCFRLLGTLLRVDLIVV